MNVAVVVGTRPEIIKMAPVLHVLKARACPHILIHSRQHYSESLDAIFFEELELAPPDYSLDVGIEASGHAHQIGGILIKIEPILQMEKPDVVLVQGDTNTVAAAALAASKLGIPVGHVEAGLRSYDRTMPEETNRIVTDHLSDFLFAVSPVQRAILLNEGIDKRRIRVVGNTVTDALLHHSSLAEKSPILDKLSLSPGGYSLLTAHRSGNVDSPPALKEVVALLAEFHRNSDEPVVWPIHPRTVKNLARFAIDLPPNVLVCEPLGYLDFLRLEANARMILTDSGGVQEEACILRVPCITIRENTERPETIDVGANVLVGRDPRRLSDAIETFQRVPRDWPNPFGDGTTAEQIVGILEEAFHPSQSSFAGSVSVVGLGYMGLPTACLLATHGVPTRGVDVDPSRVDAVNAGHSPFVETGMEELVSDAVKAGFQAGQHPEPSDVHIIAVPTPLKDNRCDLRFVMAAARSIAQVARGGDLVILESTVKPKTCERVLQPLFHEVGKKVLIAHCPERALPGNTLDEIVHNDRIIGGLTEEAAIKARDLYATFAKGELLLTDATTAEAAKLIENTYRDVNIALANELESIGRELGIDTLQAIRLANRHPRVDVLRPGPGVGGHCLPIDPWFLGEDSTIASLIPTARRINDERPQLVARIAAEILGDPSGKRIGVLGLAYKKNVDDCRQSPSLDIIEALRAMGALVRAFDPFVGSHAGVLVAGSLQELDQWAELLILATDHDAFSGAPLRTPLLDPRNLRACPIQAPVS